MELGARPQVLFWKIEAGSAEFALFQTLRPYSPIVKEPTGYEEETIRQHETAQSRHDTDETPGTGGNAAGARGQTARFRPIFS